MAADMEDYTKAYSEAGFWQKLKRFAAAAGREVVEKALLLYYAGQDATNDICHRKGQV